ncbi:MAG: CaiB/BaiF CoA-transferase family protein [Gemmatimonadota bacterium]
MKDLLQGLLVVSLEQAVSAPFASAKLAASGARVIKVERPEGDFARGYDHVVHGHSSYFVWLNRGKESVVLDIKDSADAALLHRILANADVFIQNLAPGAAARAGFDPAELRSRHPRLVTCEISGYGETGPRSGLKAYDNLVQGESGLLSVTGTAEGPARVGFSVADISAGIHAYTGILEALLERSRTGRGSGIRVSLFDCMADWMTVPYVHQVYGGAAPPRSGAHHPSIAPYGPYPAGDGEEVLVSIQNEREWVRFCEQVLRRPEVAADERFRDNASRVAHRAALDDAVVDALAAYSREALVEALEQAGIAYGRINSVAELAKHPQLRTDAAITPDGEEVRLPADPLRWEGQDADDPPPRVPTIGEHTTRVRTEFTEVIE